MWARRTSQSAGLATGSDVARAVADHQQLGMVGIRGRLARDWAGTILAGQDRRTRRRQPEHQNTTTNIRRRCMVRAHFEVGRHVEYVEIWLLGI